MATKPSSPGPNPTTTAAPAKQARSRKAATQNDSAQENVGRAGSAGGIVLEKEKEAKKKATSTAKDGPAPSTRDTQAEPSTAPNKPRRKPRKLNKDPAPATTPSPATPVAATTPSASEKPNEAAAVVELEALKSRVRGLEAKVEELYKNGTLERPGRSPRRRGKGRKMSSQQQVPTLSSAAATTQQLRVQELQDDSGVEEIADEELVRLEGELEVARQDLAQYRPRNRRTASHQTYADNDDDEDVEEIPRNAEGNRGGGNKHVTLSGSYRIPLPAAVNTEDLKTIQSGVSAAQKLASGFLEQRRAAAALRDTQFTQSSTSSPKFTSTPKKPSTPRPAPRSVNSTMEIVKADESDGGKKSWSEWIGGYSVAITRAVKSIEHEAAVESQRVGTPTAGPKRIAAGGAKKSNAAGGSGSAAGGSAVGKGKRPGVKTKLSGEQVDGLMS